MIEMNHTNQGTERVIPSHEAITLTGGGDLAEIVLNGQTYTLRITRTGKLILTK